MVCGENRPPSLFQAEIVTVSCKECDSAVPGYNTLLLREILERMLNGALNKDTNIMKPN